MSQYKSTWQSRLPEDEIGRQQAIREQLHPGCLVELRFGASELGRFVYSGIWDTMHVFYPVATATDLETILSGERRRYLRRDLRGKLFVQLPYTILADTVACITHNPPRSDL